MKFMFNGYLFRFWQDTIHVVDQYGDEYRILLTREPNNPIIINLVQKKDPNKDHAQLEFEREMRQGV